MSVMIMKLSLVAVALFVLAVAAVQVPRDLSGPTTCLLCEQTVTIVERNMAPNVTKAVATDALMKACRELNPTYPSLCATSIIPSLAPLYEVDRITILLLIV